MPETLCEPCVIREAEALLRALEDPRFCAAFDPELMEQAIAALS